MTLRSRDFKSLASAISPPGQQPYKSLFRSTITDVISTLSASICNHRFPSLRCLKSTHKAHSRKSAVWSWRSSMPDSAVSSIPRAAQPPPRPPISHRPVRGQGRGEAPRRNDPGGGAGGADRSTGSTWPLPRPPAPAAPEHDSHAVRGPSAALGLAAIRDGKRRFLLPPFPLRPPNPPPPFDAESHEGVREEEDTAPGVFFACSSPAEFPSGKPDRLIHPFRVRFADRPQGLSEAAPRRTNAARGRTTSPVAKSAHPGGAASPAARPKPSTWRAFVLTRRETWHPAAGSGDHDSRRRVRWADLRRDGAGRFRRAPPSRPARLGPPVSRTRNSQKNSRRVFCETASKSPHRCVFFARFGGRGVICRP